MSTTNDSSHTVLLLNQISQQLADLSNGSQTVILTPYRPFTPTNSALRVNAMWFLSLCFSLLCALAATLVQQWARHYLQAIDRRPAPHKKARIRAYLYQGIERFGMKTVVEGIPTLLHIALILFLVALIDFLFAINTFVAKTTLAIVAFCPALYIFITLLPIFRPDCPYKSPLSGICWHLLAKFTSLLRYKDSFGSSSYIEGSIEQGRELLATQDLPGRDQRDQEALSWTMESLTDNIELEPFVEGIPAFLGSSPQNASMMQQLVVNKDTALMDRISRLLMTCKDPGVLTEDRRRKRGIACLNAISALVTMTTSMQWTAVACGEELAWKLKAFRSQTDKALRSCAISTAEVIATRLQSQVMAAIWFENPKARGPMPSAPTRTSLTLPEEVTQGTLAKALRILHIMDSMDGLIEIIPVIIPAIEDYGVLPLTEVLLARCQYFHIPQLLLKCKDHPASMEPRSRHRRALACLRASSAMASYNFCHSTTVEAIPAFIKDNTPDIAHFANCTTARLACHLQSNIVDSLWESSSRLPAAVCLPHNKHAVKSCHSVAGHYRKLNALGVLNAFPDDVDKADLIRALKLGVTTEWPNDDTLNSEGCPEQQHLDLLPRDDLRRLEKLELRTSRGKQLSKFALALKITLNRGHIAVLISFIYFIASSPLPTLAGIDLILETLHFLTQNLTARFASRRTQIMLTSIAGKCTTKLHTDLGKLGVSNSSDRERGRSIINLLFSVMASVGDPDVVINTKAIVRDYLRQCDSTCVGAIETLRKVLLYHVLRMKKSNQHLRS